MRTLETVRNGTRPDAGHLLLGWGRPWPHAATVHERGIGVAAVAGAVREEFAPGKQGERHNCHDVFHGRAPSSGCTLLARGISGDVLPDFPALDRSDKRMGDAELGGNIAMSARHRSNYAHLRFGQLGVASALTTGFPPASFCEHVGDVVGVRAQKEMGRINASWRVAAVTDKHSGRNWTISGDPCKAMGSMSGTLPHQDAIAPIVSIALPKAAAVWAFLRVPVETLAQGVLHGTYYSRGLRWQE